jgi:hypothetical protein
VNCILDILSDVMILTIPCWLLWKVQISMRRKVALGTVLCLSVFMIIIAVIRVALDRIVISTGAEAPDTVWLYFWTNFEGAIAIIMVSLTAFRSMLGQDAVSKADPSSSITSHSATAAKDSKGSQTSQSTLSRSARGRWASLSHVQTDSDDSGPPHRASQSWTDPRLNSIRKEITIRTDFESLNGPRQSVHPPLNVRRPSAESYQPQTFLSSSSNEEIV